MPPKKRSLNDIKERMQLRSPSLRRPPNTLSPTPPKAKRPKVANTQPPLPPETNKKQNGPPKPPVSSPSSVVPSPPVLSNPTVVSNPRRSPRCLEKATTRPAVFIGKSPPRLVRKTCVPPLPPQTTQQPSISDTPQPQRSTSRSAPVPPPIIVSAAPTVEVSQPQPPPHPPIIPEPHPPIIPEPQPPIIPEPQPPIIHERVNPNAASSEAAGVQSQTKALSIRCNNEESDPGDPDVKRKRGINTGKKLRELIATLKHPLKLEKAAVHDGPSNHGYGSLMSHEIGRIVRDKVPMTAPSFTELDFADSWDIVIQNLEPYFIIDHTDDWLCNFIEEKASLRYKNWKSECRRHWAEYGNELPLEFLGRPDQWEWLCNHFSNPDNEMISQQRKKARNIPGRVNHHSGKKTFGQRAEVFANSGSSAPLIDVYAEVYSRDPNGAANAAKMKEKVTEKLAYQDEASSEVNNILEVEDQLEIIKDVVPQKRGTRVSGVGTTIRRPPLPRGGSRTRQTNDQLMSKVLYLEERIRILEEQQRGPSCGGSNASEGASLV